MALIALHLHIFIIKTSIFFHITDILRYIMVSTRGIKPKYEINERVLCYEPDPKKMKMLYDARVLEMRPSEKVYYTLIIHHYC